MQIKEYIEKSFGSKAQQYLEELKKAPSLEALVTTAFLLKITIQVLPDIVEYILKSGAGPFYFSSSLLFDYFLNGVPHPKTKERESGWFLRQVKRDSRSGQSLLFDDLLSKGKSEKEIAAYMSVYAENLAVSLLSEETGRLRQEPLTDEETLQSKLIEPAHFSDLRDDYELELYWDKEKDKANANFRAIRSSGLLCMYDSCLDGYDKVISIRFEFSHKSIVEYLVAQRLRKELESYEEDLKTLLLNWVLLREEPEIIARLAEMANEFYEPLDFKISESGKSKAKKPGLKQILLNILLASKNPDIDIGIAAANAITVLNAARVIFNQKRLSGIRIPGADLSGIIADEANLSGADLSNVWLYRANLRAANLRKAKMNGVQFGEYPYLPIEGLCETCGYSRDGRFLAIGVNKDIHLYDVTDNNYLWRTFKGYTDDVTSVSFSPDGHYLASSSYDKSIRVWDLRSQNKPRLLKGHTHYVTSVSFSPHGRYLASGGEDNSVRVWDVECGCERWQLQGHTDKVTSVSFSPDGRYLASGGEDNSVRVWDVEHGCERSQLQGHGRGVMSVSFSPDGCQLASGSWDNSIRVWDVQSSYAQRQLRGHTLAVMSVSFSPDGRQLASSSYDESIRLWDIQSGREQRQLRGHTEDVKTVSFSPDGRYLASGSHDNSVRLWEVEPSCAQRQLQGHTDYVMSVNFSPDGRQLASGSWDRSIRVWDVQSGCAQRQLRGHTGEVTSVSFSPDGRYLASGSDDKSIRLWDVESGCEQQQLRGHTGDVMSVSFSPDGRYLASGGGDGSIRLWDIQSGREQRQLRGHTAAVKSVSFSLDGGQLASGSSDESIRLWNVQSSRELRQLQGHTERVTSVSFSPDGRYLASGSGDNSVRVWEGSEMVEDKFGVPFKLVWSSHPSTQLVFESSDVSEVEGLSSVNQTLLAQRSAKNRSSNNTNTSSSSGPSSFSGSSFSSASSSSSSSASQLATFGFIATSGQTQRQTDDDPTSSHINKHSSITKKY